MNADSSKILGGYVQPGKNDASRWLHLFNDAYSKKIGMVIYPGSLNLKLEKKFDWFTEKYAHFIIHFFKEEYVGECDILLLPCLLRTLENRKAYLWSTTTAAHEGLPIVEIITDVKLREAYSLSDGDRIEVEIPELPQK